MQRAVNYTAAEVASSEHAVMQGNRTWTLYTVQADYAAAADICNSQGLQLVSVHSAADNAALAKLAAQHPKWSEGFAVNGTLLLGLRYNASMQAYEWQDGTRGDWSPFGSKGLPMPPDGKECVVILQDGWWQPISCTRLPASFACQSGDYGLLSKDYPQIKLTVNNSTSSWAQLWVPDVINDGNSTSPSTNVTSINNMTQDTSSLQQCFMETCGIIIQHNFITSNGTHAVSNDTVNGTVTPLISLLSDFITHNSACLGDEDGESLAQYMMSAGSSAGICHNITHQSNVTQWLRDLAHGTNTSQATGVCNAGLYVENYVYATANFSMSVTQHPTESAVFLKVTASVDPVWQMQQMHQQHKMIFWKQAVMPIEPALSAPPISYGLPTSYYLSVSADGTCATNGIRLPLYGGSAMFYPRVVPAADGGAYLEVWGHADTADMDPVQAAGRLGPHGWMRSAVKFISQLPAGVY
jgi:hypothetical protein